MRVFPTDSKSGAKVLSVAGVYTAELLYYAVEQPLHRRAASALASSCPGTHTKVVAKSHQGDDAAPRAAASANAMLRHDRGRIKAITKNEATHSFTSRRLKRRRALAVV